MPGGGDIPILTTHPDCAFEAGPAAGPEPVPQGAPMPEGGDTPILYTHPDCTYSAAKKAELDEAGDPYREVDLALSPERWSDLEEVTGGERITPVLIGPAVLEIGYHGVG